MYDGVIKKVHFRYLICWWVSCYRFQDDCNSSPCDIRTYGTTQ